VTTLGAKTLFFSFSNSDENLHAPNEFLRIARLREGDAGVGIALAAAGRRRDLEMTGDDYRAYSYLPEGTLPPFALTPEFDRVPPYQGAPLNDEQARRSAALLRDCLVISLHDHPVRL
jgi:hypothetical protein